MTLPFLRPNRLRPQRYWHRLGCNQQPKGASHDLLLAGIGVLLRCFLIGCLFGVDRFMAHRQPELHFNPNTRIGTATFKLLEARMANQPRGPGDYMSSTDLLLIQTSATDFKSIIAYSRRLASPDDHYLIAVFVSDTITQQPWKQLANRSFAVVNHRAIIPANWVAMLNIYQGGTKSIGTRSDLLDLRTYHATREQWEWKSVVDYATDSLKEKLHFHCAGCYAKPARKSRLFKRCLAPTDAAYFSPIRLAIRNQKD